MTNKDILNIVVEAVKAINQELNIEALESPTPDTPLYGSSAHLDSIGLVQLISEIEAMLSDQFDKNIALADERAMSRSKSPFRTISVLTEYIEELIGDDSTDP